MNTENIGHYPFLVEPFSEDIAGRLSWRFMGNHLLRCASLHAGSRGFGFSDVLQSHHAWGLSRLVIEMQEMPRTGQPYVVSTWVSKIYRQFTDRLFAITDGAGHTYGHASSIWALIDIDSRQPLDLAAISEGNFGNAVCEQTVPIAPAGRVRIKATTPERRLKALYSDLDINGHVNSIRYIEMVRDLFRPSLLMAHPPRRIELSYCAETYPGEELLLYHDTEPSGRHCVEIRKQMQEHEEVVVVKAAVELA